MPDIVMIQRRGRVYIIAETDQGKKYLEAEHIGFDNYYNAPQDTLDDLAEKYRADGFTVEVT